MANFDFSTLNATDLEDLVCDLLNHNEPTNSVVKYKTFKEGKDKGIDVLYSTNLNKYEHVCQVKHYYRTGFKGLIQDLKKTEVKKVKHLKPNKYIFATSVDLSVAQTEEIQTAFHPYIKDLKDIYGKKDLNRLIEKNSAVILRNHYKLWLSSFDIISTILNSDLEFRSSNFLEYEFKKRIRIYVKTDLFDKARTSLEENKFIIIAGEPGVGKTTLAEMLVYKYIAEGFKLAYILQNTKEAEAVLLPDDSKQIIFFDDFLGSNWVEINQAKGSETALLRILRRIATLKNKYLVFTTRSHLLITSIEESENLRRFNIKTKTSFFELKEYSLTLKEKILENHVEEAEIKDELKEVLRDEKIIDFIVKHTSFAPRSIEFITSKEQVNNFNSEEFKKFIYNNFDKPDLIWKHAYSEQIKEQDRLLLNTLLSFGQSALYCEIEAAFNKRIEYEIRYNNYRKETHTFIKALKRLEGGFLTLKNRNEHPLSWPISNESEILKRHEFDEVQFINPSLIDFLLSYIKKDIDEVNRIIECISYVNQLTARLFKFNNKNTKLPLELKQRLLNDSSSFIRPYEKDQDSIELAMVLYSHTEIRECEELICDILDGIEDWDVLNKDYSLKRFFKEFLYEVKSNHKIFTLISGKLVEIITELIRDESDINDAIDLLEKSTKDLDIDFNAIDTTHILEYLEELFTDYISSEIDWLKDWITDEGEADNKLQEIKELADRVNWLGLNLELDYEEFNIDWYEIAVENEFRRQMEKD
jgi:hypothetical protein